MDRNQRAPDRAYGSRDGLEERLEQHIRKLGTDHRLPWVGMGLIDDLRAAIDAISEPVITGTPLKISPLEFDL